MSRSFPTTKVEKNTSFIYLTESYRDGNKVKHRTIRDLGLFENDQVPYIKAALMKTSFQSKTLSVFITMTDGTSKQGMAP